MIEIIKTTEPSFAENSYLICDSERAIAIDPVPTKEFIKAARKVCIDFVFLTHEHYDHICGINNVRLIYKGIKVLCGQKAVEGLGNPAINLSRYTEYITTVLPFGNGSVKGNEYTCFADGTVKDGQIIDWQGHRLLIKETPGHSAGSISILIDNQMLFSGDVLFQKYPTATRIPGGSKKMYEKTTKDWIKTLSQDIIVYPGHLEPFPLSERFPE